MPKRTTTYQYKSGDTPLTVAEQYGLTPQELLDANPGGAPFSIGQTIKLPTRPPLSPTPAGTQGFQYRPPTPPANINFNWKGPQYQNQLQQSFAQAGLYGVQNAAMNIGADIAGEGLNTINQAGTFAAGTVNAIGKQAWQSFRNSYDSALPDNVIRQIALVNPSLAYSLYVSKQRGTTSGRNVTRPGYAGITGAPPPGYGPNAFAAGYGTDDGWYNANQPGALAPGTPAAYNPAQPQTSNNWQTNPALYQLTFNKNAKNRKNTFETSLKWAQNAWRRKAGRGKNRQVEQAQQQMDFTLANSLISFGASSG